MNGRSCSPRTDAEEELPGQFLLDDRPQSSWGARRGISGRRCGGAGAEDDRDAADPAQVGLPLPLGLGNLEGNLFDQSGNLLAFPMDEDAQSDASDERELELGCMWASRDLYV